MSSVILPCKETEANFIKFLKCQLFLKALMKYMVFILEKSMNIVNLTVGVDSNTVTEKKNMLEASVMETLTGLSKSENNKVQRLVPLWSIT